MTGTGSFPTTNVSGVRHAPAGRVIELAHLRAVEERGHLGTGVDQHRPARVPGVADGDPSVAKPCHFDAAAAGVAVTTLLPDDAGQKGRRQAVVDRLDLDSSIVVTPADRSSCQPAAPRWLS